MLFDVGWPELMLIGAVALVVVGPKDLPRALRIAGMWVRKARNMSRDLQNSVEQMIRDAELDDIRRDIQQTTEFDFEHEIRNTVDPAGSLTESLKLPDAPDYFEPTLPALDMPAIAAPQMGEIAVPELDAAAPADDAEEPELPFPPPEPPSYPEPSPHPEPSKL